MPGWSFFPYLSYFITVLIKLLTWHSLNVITSHFNLVQWSWRRPCIHHHGMTMYVRAPSRFCNISTTKIQTSVAIFLLMTMSSFRPYVVPSLIGVIFLRTTCAYLFLFPLSPRCGEMFCDVFLCLHVVSCPVSFCFYAGIDSLSSYLRVGLNFFLVWPKHNHILNNR